MLLNPFSRDMNAAKRVGRKVAPLATEQLEPRHALAAVLSMVGPTDVVAEGQPASFTLKLSEVSKVPQRVAVTTQAGTAKLGLDYFAPAKQYVLFSPGQTSQTFSISTLRDAGGDKTEGEETFTVFATPDNAALGKARFQKVTIADVTGPGGYGVVGSNFQITFSYDSTVTSAVKDALKQAADRWSRVIVGDLPDVSYQGRTIDDLEIAVKVVPEADLPAGVIAGANYDARRSGAGGLPYLGSIEISSAYVSAPGIMNTLTHEIGHALGFGSLWARETEFQSLVTGVGTANPAFVGANALREYRSLFGLTTTTTNVPLYGQSSLRPANFDGSYGSHWRDSVFNNSSGTYFELMTPAYDVTGTINGAAIPAILSRVTVGAMQDLGYVVSYKNVETYAPPSNSVNNQRATGGGNANSRNLLWSTAGVTLSAGLPGQGQSSGAIGGQATGPGGRTVVGADTKPCPPQSAPSTPVAAAGVDQRPAVTVVPRRVAPVAPVSPVRPGVVTVVSPRLSGVS